MAFDPTAGRFGGGSLHAAGLTLQSLATPLFPTKVKYETVFNFGFNFKAVATDSYDSITAGKPIVALPNNLGASALLAGLLYLNPANGGGNLVMGLLGSNNLGLQAAGRANLLDGRQHWVEVQLKISSNAANGSCTIYVDGIQDLVYTGATAVAGVTSLNGNVNVWNGAPNNANAHMWFDDFILWDATGTPASDVTTFPIGPQRIVTLDPNADGDSIDFTPSAVGTHFGLVSGSYNAASYVSDAAANTGKLELFKFPALPFVPNAITALVLNLFGQNPGSTSLSILPKVKLAGTVGTGASVLLANGVNKLSQTPFPRDPSGNVWVAANVNTAQAGVGD
jgi:hypothetical protein